MKIDLQNLSIAKARKHLAKGDFSARELTEAYLSEIEKKNPEIHAYLNVFEDALLQADESDKRIREGKARSLEGIPVAVKDNILIKGKRATAGSKILENYTASYDATVIQNLKEAGAVLLGSTNLDEFAMGASTESSAYGITKNPLDTGRVPGGSSGGSAAAVAANMCLVALGSDTAGSVRQPSAFCGTVGLKPTYGSVSRHGLIALGSSLDVIGPIAKSVSDAEEVFDVIKGKDPMDSTSTQYDEEEKIKVERMVIGMPRDVLESEDLDPEVLVNFKEGLKRLLDIGVEIKEIDLPHLKHAVPAYYIILPAEASSNLARFDGVKYGLRSEGEDLLATYLKSRGEGFGPEPRRRILIGTYVLSAGYADEYYNKAQAVRKLIRDDFDKAFVEVDVIVMPTAVGPAFKIGDKADDPVKMYLQDKFTVPANHAGIPALTVPSGTVKVDDKELPLGIQFMSSHGQEGTLFSLGQAFLKE
jgi:aspartyl-tRNA(Asn)/glutamyl-tRNA(Gln) amidotransferase subunit A